MAIDVSTHPMIAQARYGTRLNTQKKILYNPKKEYIAMLNASLEIGNNLLCIWYAKLPARVQIRNERINNAPLIIEHHIKKVLMVIISIVSLKTIA
jgi:uncharacterized protein with PQ loop repeat